MNINQQSEVEDLFKRVNKDIHKNNKFAMEDTDLNKVRAYVVQSQRPMQAVRLLQKEREERDIDDKFNKQKEEIIAKAKQLDEEGKAFAAMQQNMTQMVQEDISTMVRNTLKRKEEMKKLAEAEQRVKQRKKTIEELNLSNKLKAQSLEHSQNKLGSYSKFSEFLEDVVQDKDLGTSGDSDVNWIKQRFVNLKGENKKLKMRKIEINQQMEEIQAKEREMLARMKKELYDKQKMSQTLQLKIEHVSEKNSELEQEFETEITKHNTDRKESGQIISAIGNIYNICVKLAADKNPPRKLVEMKDVQGERKPELLDDLKLQLTTSQEYVGDLIAVSKTLAEKNDNRLSNREKYYEDLASKKAKEQIENTNPNRPKTEARRTGNKVSDGGRNRTKAFDQSEFSYASK